MEPDHLWSPGTAQNTCARLCECWHCAWAAFLGQQNAFGGSASSPLELMGNVLHRKGTIVSIGMILEHAEVVTRYTSLYPLLRVDTHMSLYDLTGVWRWEEGWRSTCRPG